MKPCLAPRRAGRVEASLFAPRRSRTARHLGVAILLGLGVVAPRWQSALAGVSTLPRPDRPVTTQFLSETRVTRSLSGAPLTSLRIPDLPDRPQFLARPVAFSDRPTTPGELSTALRSAARGVPSPQGRSSGPVDATDQDAVAVPLPMYGTLGTAGIGLAMCYAGARWLRIHR